MHLANSTTKSQSESIFFFPKEGERSHNLLACGIEKIFCVDLANVNNWLELDEWIADQHQWIFCWISYDAKNAIENLSSRHADHVRIPQLMFVVPEHVVRWNDDSHEVLKGEWSDEFYTYAESGDSDFHAGITLNPRLSKQEYLFAVNELLKQIQEGNIYEVNFCQEFFADEKLKSPLEFWKKLRYMTRAPFSAYVKHSHLSILCASPERFLKKEGNKLISQPIKGTIRRGKSKEEDDQLKADLYRNPKERSENVMIVDLVRNDLSKSALRGSVKVDELFGVHTFNTVHHLISTVSSEVKSGIAFSQLIRDTFPMGSMTGAPKVSAMKLIDQCEFSIRGLYSGTIGYITPKGDFDLNVVIRSILYNDEVPYVSLHVGSAITSQCIPESEYEECLLKAKALISALQ